MLRWGEAWDEFWTGLLGPTHGKTRPAWTTLSCVLIVFVRVTGGFAGMEHLTTSFGQLRRSEDLVKQDMSVTGSVTYLSDTSGQVTDHLKLARSQY